MYAKFKAFPRLVTVRVHSKIAGRENKIIIVHYYQDVHTTCSKPFHMMTFSIFVTPSFFDISRHLSLSVYHIIHPSCYHLCL